LRSSSSRARAAGASAASAETAGGDKASGEMVRGGDSSTTRSTVPAAIFAAGMTPTRAGTCAIGAGAWVNGRNKRRRVALNLPGRAVGRAWTTSGCSAAAERERPLTSGAAVRSAGAAGAGTALGGVTVVAGAARGVG
jgi:hypothetical protein